MFVIFFSVQDAIEQLMSASKINDSRESSVTQKTDLDDLQQKDAENNRRNNSGRSWWNWSRRSTDSGDKKSPSKEMDESISSRQSVERVDEMKEVINDLDNISLDDTGTIDPNDYNSSKIIYLDQQTTDSALGGDNTDIAKNDDSISSELADISKSSFSSEKYRKTLRLTSEQIVRNYLIYKSILYNVFINCFQNLLDITGQP